ncbi:MAG: serine/threonine protein kinase [Deltaproteobacteria bacterium]|nr:serine/threonine protein kinase [Deltaproteobacteria bacterium]
MSIATVPTALPAGGSAIRCCGICGASYRTEFQRCPNDGGELVLGVVDPLVGMTLGDHYVIEALLGEGAMGRVYRAHHHRLTGRRFAVKVMLGDLAVDPEMRMRFAREAEATSRLDHPGVVGVHDFGRTPTGLLFLVMELVEGETLGRVLRRGPMAPERVIRLARQLCHGLAHAHARGIVHRDLKPDNILVVAPGTPAERVRISDFGLAITHDDDARLTTSGVVCTPAYAAPEQLFGRDVDGRADLYALGSTMFEMLTGGIPVFAGDAQQVTAKKLAGEMRSLSVLAPNAPAPLIKLIHKLLEADPAKRPPSATDVIARLDGTATSPTIAVPVLPPKHRWVAAVCGIATLVIAGAAGSSGIAPTTASAPEAVEPAKLAPHVIATARVEAPPRPRAITVAPPPLPPRLAPVPAPVPAMSASLRLVSFDVEGSLSRAVVERALERVDLHACTGNAPVVAARFTIGDSRRAGNVHATSRCVADALAHVRTEVAPDIGETTIALRFARR